ncbi:hypothetical protein ERO13_A08G138801v2, partial [Gossypium hirsutum]
FLFPTLFTVYLFLACKTIFYPYQNLTSKTLNRQPFLASFDSGILPLHPRSGDDISPVLLQLDIYSSNHN